MNNGVRLAICDFRIARAIPFLAAVALLATRGGRADAVSAAGVLAVTLASIRRGAVWERLGPAAWPVALALGWTLAGAGVAADQGRALFAWAHLCGLAGVAMLAAQVESRPHVFPRPLGGEGQGEGAFATGTQHWMIVAVGSACLLAVCSLAGMDLLAGKNLTGGFLVLGAALAAGLDRGADRPRRGRWILATFVLVILAGLINTRSLGAWMGAAVAATTWVVARWRWRGMAGVAVALLAGVVATPSRTLESAILGHPDAPYSRVRSVLWRAAARTSLQHPLFGVGLDHFGTTLDIAAPVVSGTPIRRLKWTPFAHSEYLQAAVESGWPAAAALAWLIALIVRAAWRHLTDPIPSPVRIAASLAAIAGLTHAMVDFTLHLPLIAATVAASAGVALTEPPRPEPGWRPPGWAAIFPATMILAALIAVLGLRSVIGGPGIGGAFSPASSRYEPQRMAGRLTWPAVASFSAGESAMVRGLWREAESEFRSALREEPRFARAQFRLADIAATRGDRPLASRRRRIAEDRLASNTALRRSIRYATEGYGDWVLGR